MLFEAETIDGNTHYDKMGPASASQPYPILRIVCTDIPDNVPGAEL